MLNGILQDQRPLLNVTAASVFLFRIHPARIRLLWQVRLHAAAEELPRIVFHFPLFYCATRDFVLLYCHYHCVFNLFPFISVSNG